MVSIGVQPVAGPGAHTPAWQESPTVQTLLSEQVVPFIAAAQTPVAIEHGEQMVHAAPEFCGAPLASHSCG